MIATAMGTPYELDTAGAIVFLEDVSEELYRIGPIGIGATLDADAGTVTIDEAAVS